MRFKAPYDTLVHRLKNGYRIWGQKYELNVGQVWDWRMGWTIVNDKSNISIICTKLSVEFTDPLFKDLTIHPTLLLWFVLTG